MSVTVRAACEAAAWAFAGVFMAAGLFFFSISGSVEDIGAMTAAHGLVGAVTAFAAVAVLVRARFPGKSPVVGARHGAAIGALVVLVVPTASAFVFTGSSGILYSIYGQVFWSVVGAGGPFAMAGAVVGRWMDRRLFGSHGS